MNPLKDSAFHRAGVAAALERTKQNALVSFMSDFDPCGDQIPIDSQRQLVDLKERVLRACQSPDYIMPVDDQMQIADLRRYLGK